jgi:hypothetical protein
MQQKFIDAFRSARDNMLAVLCWSFGTMTLRSLLLGAAVCMLPVVTAQAATLIPTGGDVYDRTGSRGFHKVTSAAEVQPGDTVMAGPNGSAQITFSDGYSITVGPGQTVIVPEKHQATDDPNAGQYLVGGAVAAIFGISIYEIVSNSVAPRPASP